MAHSLKKMVRTERKTRTILKCKIVRLHTLDELMGQNFVVFFLYLYVTRNRCAVLKIELDMTGNTGQDLQLWYLDEFSYNQP